MHAMNKPFTVAAVVIFAIVALIHLLRFVLGWNANIAGTEIPMWVSVAALVIAGGLEIGLWRDHEPQDGGAVPRPTQVGSNSKRVQRPTRWSKADQRQG